MWDGLFSDLLVAQQKQFGSHNVKIDLGSSQLFQLERKSRKKKFQFQLYFQTKLLKIRVVRHAAKKGTCILSGFITQGDVFEVLIAVQLDDYKLMKTPNLFLM